MLLYLRVAAVEAWEMVADWIYFKVIVDRSGGERGTGKSQQWLSRFWPEQMGSWRTPGVFFSIHVPLHSPLLFRNSYEWLKRHMKCPLFLFVSVGICLWQNIYLWWVFTDHVFKRESCWRSQNNIWRRWNNIGNNIYWGHFHYYSSLNRDWVKRMFSAFQVYGMK